MKIEANPYLELLQAHLKAYYRYYWFLQVNATKYAKAHYGYQN